MTDFDTVTEKTLSNLVEYQFPEFIRTDGPLFIEFVRQYYKWLEGISLHAVSLDRGTVTAVSRSAAIVGVNTTFLSDFTPGDYFSLTSENGDNRVYVIDSVTDNTHLTLTSPTDFGGSGLAYGTAALQANALYHTRRLFDYRDIDKTADEFVVYFKEKYLKGIQFETETNTRMLVKHALDIYRSKGTERSLDLLFRIVFGVGATFYYPGDDVFKLSDGDWYVPRYLEISLNNNSPLFINQQITGLTSGATAFVESLVRRTVKGRLIDVLYISAIKGNFLTNEIINVVGGPTPNNLAPRIIGSLSELEVSVDGVSELYAIGDSVNVWSNSGEQGIARVTSVSDITGLVNFTFANSGYGFTANAEVYVSEQVLVLGNVTTANQQAYYGLFETVTQPLANIAYVNANGAFLFGDPLFTWANAVQTGSGSVLAVTQTNSTAGTILARVDSGTLNSPKIYTTGNAIAANTSLFLDVSATGSVIAYSSNVQLTTSNLSGVFADGETVYQYGIVGGSNVVSVTATLGDYSGAGLSGSMKLTNAQASFIPGQPIIGASSNARAVVNTVSINMGYIDGLNSFVALPNNYIVGNSVGTNATISAIGSGTGAGFTLANNLLFSEDISVYTDIISPYASVAINATAYGFPQAPSANSGNTMASAFASNTVTIGRPSRIANINKGEGYNIPPFVLVYEPQTYPFAEPSRQILTLDINPYIPGEIITQDAVSSRGVVVSASGSNVVVDVLRFNANNQFVATSNATTVLSGDLSGASANILGITTDMTQGILGYQGGNFKLTANTQTSNGAVTGLKVIDSGFGFQQDEQVIFQKDDLEAGQAFAVLKTNGQSQGRYKKLGGMLSDSKKLFDGLYYQDFSYEIRSSVMLDKYEDMLKQLLHVAGTKYFGAFVKQSNIPATIQAETTLVTSS